MLDDKRQILITKIKAVIIEMIHYSNEVPAVNHSDYINEKLGYGHTCLANIFSEVKGITIQHYIILNQIERVKELLLYDEFNLTEIAFKLHAYQNSPADHSHMWFEMGNPKRQDPGKPMDKPVNDVNLTPLELNISPGILPSFKRLPDWFRSPLTPQKD